MIGFKMEATGSNGFRRSSSAWTEGSMIALKIALSLPKANPPGMGKTRRGIISSIESSFNKIGKALLNRVCSLGVNFTLFVSGDMKFKYFFDYSKSSEQIKGEFLKQIAQSQKKVGDQVMIHLCRTIEDFVLLNFDSGGNLILKIDVDL